MQLTNLYDEGPSLAAENRSRLRSKYSIRKELLSIVLTQLTHRLLKKVGGHWNAGNSFGVDRTDAKQKFNKTKLKMFVY